MTKTLRAADLGYVWLESIPDGRAWVKERTGDVRLWENRPSPDKYGWFARGKVLSKRTCELFGIPIPDFGDLDWTECILVKGDEPPESDERQIEIISPATEYRGAVGRDVGTGKVLPLCYLCGRPEDEHVERKCPEALRPPELPPCPPGEGWLEWGGGECPIEGRAEVQLRSGVLGAKADSSLFRWTHNGVSTDIIRYREPPKPKLRPYNAEELEALVGKPLRCVEDKDVCLVERARRMKVFVAGLWYGTDEMLQDWQHLDGSPCGEEVTDA